MRSATALLVAGLSVGCGSGVATVRELDEELGFVEEPLFLGDPANGAFYALDLSMWEGPIAQWEMDCFWNAGVRHIVSGTQVEEITRQQLAMARRRGMSLDAYVYLYWDRDVRAQVEEALRRADGFGIGRMWLDVEEAPPAGTSAQALAELLQQAVDACRAQTGAGCGIYTGAGFWTKHLANTTRFAEVPLWFAHYDDVTSLSAWPSERFGGWAAPAAKQWQERALCGVGPDHDTMQRLRGPELVVDRSPAPAPASAPPPPSDLYPEDGQRTAYEYVKLMAATVPGASAYELAMELWSGSRWLPYAAWTRSVSFKKVSPYRLGAFYRFRARAKNAYGWGPYSAWAAFEYGTATGARPPGFGAPPPPGPGAGSPDAGALDAGAPADAGSDPDAGTGSPTALSPNGNASYFKGASVTLSCAAVAGATAYAFELEVLVGASWTPYFTYSAAAPSKTFWPQTAAPFRWRARATVAGVAGPWSGHATFTVR